MRARQVGSMAGNQLFDRLFLFGIWVTSAYPKYEYTKHVSMRTMHSFTLFQVSNKTELNSWINDRPRGDARAPNPACRSPHHTYPARATEFEPFGALTHARPRTALDHQGAPWDHPTSSPRPLLTTIIAFNWAHTSWYWNEVAKLDAVESGGQDNQTSSGMRILTMNTMQDTLCRIPEGYEHDSYILPDHFFGGQKRDNHK